MLKAFEPSPLIGHKAKGCTSGTDPFVPPPPSPPPPPPPPPAPAGALNVLFIAVDDLRSVQGTLPTKNLLENTDGLLRPSLDWGTKQPISDLLVQYPAALTFC